MIEFQSVVRNISFTLSMHESSSGLIASESCNSWIVKLILGEKNGGKRLYEILAKVYNALFAGPCYLKSMF